MRAWIVIPLLLAGPVLDLARACSCGGNVKPFCERLPASAESSESAVFLGTVESVYPTKEQDRQMMEAYFKEFKESTGTRSWPPDDPEQLLKIWRDVLTPAEVLEIRRGGADNPVPSMFRNNRRLIRLRVDETFVGSPSQTFELIAGSGECCDCSPRFGAGEQYLVVAGRWQGRWTTSTCAGTAQAKFAMHDVTALRAWRRGQRVAPGIYGTAFDGTRRQGRPGEPAMAAGIRIRLSGNGLERETRTDADGLFTFEGLANASYQLQVDEPGWSAQYNWNPLTQQVDLTGRGCAQPYFGLQQTQASIRGRLVGPAGAQMNSIAVVAVSEAQPENGNSQRVGRTNAKGEFTIAQLEPGKYVLGINVNATPVSAKSPVSRLSPDAPYPTIYYPGVADRAVAQVLPVDRGQMLDLANWTVPERLKDRKFEGVVRWPDGTPAADARVFLMTPAPSFGLLQRAQPTGPDGVFTIWGLEGVKYRLSAVVQKAAASYHWGEVGEIDRADGLSVVLDRQEKSAPFYFMMEFAPQPLRR